MRAIRGYYLVPVDLCKLCLQEGLVNTTRVHIYLKYITSGKTRITKELINKTSKHLQLDLKTVKKHIDIMYDRNWLGFNPASGYTFIRGFESLRIIEGFTTRAGSEFLISEINEFKEFCVASFVGYLLNRQKSRLWQSERLKARSSQDCHKACDFRNCISNETIGQFLGKSKSTASRYIRSAEKVGYFKVEYNYTSLTLNRRDLGLVEKHNPRIKYKGGEVVMQEPNIIHHNMHFRRREKLQP